jgi:hypothetical protein
MTAPQRLDVGNCKHQSNLPFFCGVSVRKNVLTASHELEEIRGPLHELLALTLLRRIAHTF